MRFLTLSEKEVVPAETVKSRKLKIEIIEKQSDKCYIKKIEILNKNWNTL